MTHSPEMIDHLKGVLEFMRRRFGGNPDVTEPKRSSNVELDSKFSDPEPEPELGPVSIDYLDALAARSFDRQTDLDESIWRSLPFFAATFAFVAALVGRSATDVPYWSWNFYALIMNALVIAATVNLAWCIRWFWTVLRPRQYEYPATDAAVRRYAEQMMAYYADRGFSKIMLDENVAREVKLFMIDQHGSGAATNLGHNAVKLKARSKVLLFMLVGFVLAFACEATIFVHDRLYPLATDQERSGNVTASIDIPRPPQPYGTISPGATSGAVGNGRSPFLGAEFKGGSQIEVTSRKPPSGKPVQTQPLKPRPPAMQLVTKLNDGARVQGGMQSEPKPKTK